MEKQRHGTRSFQGGGGFLRLWCLGAVLLAAAYLLCLLLPAEAGADPAALARGAEGQIWAVAPGGELVQLDDGGPVAWLLRSRVMGDVQAVASQSGAVIAIDRDGRLWGWRSGGARSILAEKLPDEPTLLAQAIRQAAVGDRYVAAVTEDGGLLLLDGTGRTAPCMPGRQVQLCRVVGDRLYAVTTDGALFQMDGAGLLHGAPARQVAVGVADVNVARGMTAQCRMADGSVRLLADGSLSGPVHEGAAAVCVNALVSRDGELLVWRPDGPGGGTLALQRRDGNVAAAFSETLYLGTDGRLRWDGIAFPVSLRVLAPRFRDLFFLWAAGLLLSALLHLPKPRRRKDAPDAAGS